MAKTVNEVSSSDRGGWRRYGGFTRHPGVAGQETSYVRNSPAVKEAIRFLDFITVYLRLLDTSV